MDLYLYFRHFKFINNLFFGSLSCSCILVRWGWFCVITASEDSPCCHIYPEMMFRFFQSVQICEFGKHFLQFRLVTQWLLVLPPLFCSMISNKLDFSSFSVSVVSCNLEYKRSFLLYQMHSVERIVVGVLCLVLLRRVWMVLPTNCRGELSVCLCWDPNLNTASITQLAACLRMA